MSNTQTAIDLLHVLEKTEAQRDELLLELEQARIDIFYYGNNDFNKTIKNIDKAIAKAKGE